MFLDCLNSQVSWPWMCETVSWGEAAFGSLLRTSAMPLCLQEDESEAWNIAMNAWLARVARYFTYCLNGVWDLRLTQKKKQPDHDLHLDFTTDFPTRPWVFGTSDSIRPFSKRASTWTMCAMRCWHTRRWESSVVISPPPNEICQVLHSLHLQRNIYTSFGNFERQIDDLFFFGCHPLKSVLKHIKCFVLIFLTSRNQVKLREAMLFLLHARPKDWTQPLGRAQDQKLRSRGGADRPEEVGVEGVEAVAVGSSEVLSLNKMVENQSCTNWALWARNSLRSMSSTTTQLGDFFFEKKGYYLEKVVGFLGMTKSPASELSLNVYYIHNRFVAQVLNSIYFIYSLRHSAGPLAYCRFVGCRRLLWAKCHCVKAGLV